MPSLRPPFENQNALARGTADSQEKLLQGRTSESIIAEFERQQAALLELRAAMEKRDNTAAEAARLADEEASLNEESAFAIQEKEATLLEAQAQTALLESVRLSLERLESPEAKPDESALAEARRNWSAAKTANNTAVKEAKVAADVVSRMAERLLAVQKRRGEIRWQQSADHEAFERMARSLRIFTPETMAEAFADLEKRRPAYDVLVKAFREGT